MWQLFDIAYIIPASVFIGYWLGRYLETKFGQDEYLTYSIMFFALMGFVLTIVKIKRFVDSVNNKNKEKDIDIKS